MNLEEQYREVPENDQEVSRNELFLELHRNNFFGFSFTNCLDHLKRYVSQKLNYQTFPETKNSIIKVFVHKTISRWRQSHRILDRFKNKNREWLKAIIFQARRPLRNVNKAGRPKKPFNQHSEKSKIRAASKILRDNDSEKVVLAAQIGLYNAGNRTAAKVVKYAASSSTNKAHDMKNAHDSENSPLKPYSPEEALALIIDTDLTKEQYLQIQQGAKSRGANIYPPWNIIADTKQKCYPSNINIFESGAEVPLQDLLDHTISRLAQAQEEVFCRIPVDIKEVFVVYKWGMDGSGGHSIYKQNFSNNSAFGDSNIILKTICPLEVYCIHQNKKLFLWKNLRPSSTRNCRPISFKFKRETTENIKSEYEDTKHQIGMLQPTELKINENQIKFTHILHCTMLDGKTCNVVTDSASSQTCNVCKVTPKDINDLKKVLKRTCNENTFQFGISVLHCSLRFYEFLLHIAYKLETRNWQARSKEDKEIVKRRKNYISQNFYEKLGLVVDLPKQGGGNSNDGNTARAFFQNPVVSAEITGLDVKLITRFANILSALSSGFYIQIENFRSYCLETAELYIELYGWYNMSATVHKVLIHGADICKSLNCPPGQLSEDVIEASHKQYKKIRQYHSRKTGRIETNTDVIHYFMLASDPHVSSFRKDTRKTSKVFNCDVLKMLDTPDFLKLEIYKNVDIDML